MCKFCENEIYKNSDGSFFLQVETLEWDAYYDCYETVDLDGIKYCPFCGQELEERKMKCLKKAYTIDIGEWLREKNIPDDIYCETERGIWEFFLYDDISNDSYKRVDLESITDDINFTDEYYSSETKVAMPYIKQFIKELKEEGLTEVLIEICW